MKTHQILGLLALIMLIVLTACSSPPQGATDAAIKSVTDQIASIGGAMRAIQPQTLKVASSKQYQLSPADKMSNYEDKWCLILGFVYGGLGGVNQYADGQVLVRVVKIQGKWDAYFDYPWFPPPLSCPDNLQ